MRTSYTTRTGAHTYVTLNYGSYGFAAASWHSVMSVIFLSLFPPPSLSPSPSPQYVPSRINYSRSTERVQNHLADTLVSLWTLSMTKFVDSLVRFFSNNVEAKSFGQISKI